MVTVHGEGLLIALPVVARTVPPLILTFPVAEPLLRKIALAFALAVMFSTIPPVTSNVPQLSLTVPEVEVTF